MRTRKRKRLPAGYTVAKEDGHGSYPWVIRYQGREIACTWAKGGTTDYARRHALIQAKRRRAARKAAAGAT